MSSGNFKQDVYAQLARVAKAVGHANRLELLEFVAQGPRSVDELANMTHLSVANASKHLQELRQAGLVRARKEGVRDLRQSGLLKVKSGMTSLEEVEAITNE